MPNERTNLFAFTEFNQVYPAYASLNKEPDGRITLSVRSRDQQYGSCMEMSPRILKQLSDAIRKELGYAVDLG